VVFCLVDEPAQYCHEPYEPLGGRLKRPALHRVQGSSADTALDRIEVLTTPTL
jgi:hypothetical protein